MMLERYARTREEKSGEAEFLKLKERYELVSSHEFMPNQSTNEEVGSPRSSVGVKKHFSTSKLQPASLADDKSSLNQKMKNFF